MLRGTARDLTLSTIALAALAPALIGAAVSAHAAGSVIVHSKYGGYLLGFGVDPVGNEGLLSEYIALKTGKSFIATETFDRATGKIVKVIAKQNNTRDAYGTWGVFGPQVGVDEYYQARKKTFPVLNPLSGNTFNGAWSLSIAKGYYLSNIVGNLKNSDVAVLTFSFGTDLPTVFASNVAANTFGQGVTVNNQDFCDCASPVIALDDQANEAVLASTNGETPEIAIADFGSGNVTTFAGVGYGYVNGIAVDGLRGIAVTTTGGAGFEPAGVQFYDLNKQTGFEVFLPCSGDGGPDYPGLTVAFDPEHSLFLIEQLDTTCSSGTAIDVYDEKGNLQEMLTNFATLPASPTPIALHPKDRTGFVYEDRTATSLQSFSY